MVQVEEEVEDQNLFNVSDFVLIKADPTMTPNQRFWVGQVLART